MAGQKRPLWGSLLLRITMIVLIWQQDHEIIPVIERAASWTSRSSNDQLTVTGPLYTTDIKSHRTIVHSFFEVDVSELQQASLWWQLGGWCPWFWDWCWQHSGEKGCDWPSQVHAAKRRSHATLVFFVCPWSWELHLICGHGGNNSSEGR